MSPNVFYTGAAPNQQAIPAVEYLMSEDGGGAKRFFLQRVHDAHFDGVGGLGAEGEPHADDRGGKGESF